MLVRTQASASEVSTMVGKKKFFKSLSMREEIFFLTYRQSDLKNFNKFFVLSKLLYNLSVRSF